ncbi:energy transducer TonB family protein [Sphingobium sp. YR768]|uniref:energy transducer TonB family protein n=1 Tax=Sphingobium sp. YR768 TaxID=1884365 RepID=UPI002109725E|nr:TonB family protein [Sphingobium sp. YR768]
MNSDMDNSGLHGRYRSSGSSHLIGVGGTCALYAICAVVFFVALSTQYAKPAQQAALTVLSLSAPASPPEIEPRKRKAPTPTEQKEAQREPPRVQRIEPSKIAISPVSTPIPIAGPRSADPRPVEPEPAAPKTAPAPPASQVSSNAHDTWEGRVLAALNKHRRYPRLAMVRRQQGVPYIRFIMDREGKVLSSHLERSSGVSELDREAISLPKRASPLPKPPQDKSGDTLELVVPVEYFLK